ncbi:MAG: hypothetical protein P1P88_25555, partial [Bacteroidales bacterium]|nr:hypothetical protein [Bacteroidales bacterium]
MKSIFFSTIIFFCFLVNLSAQEISSGTKKIKISSTPKLVIDKVVLFDENNNKTVEASENCYFEITVKNT